VTHLVLLAVGGVALGYSSLLLLLWRFQERIVFQPPADVAAQSVSTRQVRYRADDGVELFAYVVGECVRDKPVVLAFHGNADVSRWLIPWATSVTRETGACVVLPEYRGYDGLRGVPTYGASSLDARAALRFVSDTLHAAPANLVYFGHSLGSAVATELASFQPPRALVLQSPFSSAREMGNRMYLPGLTVFWGLVSRVHFDTMRRVRTLASPVWVAHGDKDLVIPVQMGRAVFAAAKHKGDLLIVHNAGHNDVPGIGGAAYWTWLAGAIRGDPVTVIRAAPAGTRSEP
jgi:Dipeptidyl aminopeptidases/acylaminoacyl-peptidases